MNINALLNPFDCSGDRGCRGSESPTPAILHRQVAPCASTPKRQKVPKDAAIFTDAQVNGPVNFPPHEAGDDEKLSFEHRRFQIYPLGNIQRKGARRIPYNSDKKDFMPKTGRDAFEVFQYEFKLPGEDKTYYVLWDYQVGLVRITPFFKCCKYNKTTPAKVLNLNQGLRNISYSITGGALAAQGYWMPYHAAKAVAATFCYDIRYALTPVFGNDFPSICTLPTDPSYAKFLIDPAIVQQCTEETRRWRSEGVTYRPLEFEQRAMISREDVHPQLDTPPTKFACPPWGPKPSRHQHKVSSDLESGYGTTDEDFDEKYKCSPEVSPRSAWTPINRTYSPASLSAFSPHQQCLTSVPGGGIREVQRQVKRTLSKAVYDEEDEGERPATAESTTTAATEAQSRAEMESAVTAHSLHDFNAAEALLNLYAADNEFHRNKRTRHASGH